MRLIVCPQSRLAEARRRAPAAPVLSLLSPGAPLGDRRAGDLHLRFHDISAPREGFTPPDAAMVGAILDMARRDPATLIIHCYAGVSRSTAAAFIIAADRGGDALTLAHALRARSPEATPNAWLVALADEALGRGGAMSHAIERMGRGCDAYEGRLFEWDL